MIQARRFTIVKRGDQPANNYYVLIAMTRWALIGLSPILNSLEQHFILFETKGDYVEQYFCS